MSEEEEEEKQDPQWTRYRRQRAAARKAAGGGGGGDRHRRGAWTAAAQRCATHASDGYWATSRFVWKFDRTMPTSLAHVSGYCLFHCGVLARVPTGRRCWKIKSDQSKSFPLVRCTSIAVGGGFAGAVPNPKAGDSSAR